MMEGEPINESMMGITEQPVVSDAERRTELRKVLPSDIQIRFSQKRPDREKWLFDGELTGRIHSELDEDRYFFEATKAWQTGNQELIEELKVQSSIQKE